MQSLGHMTQGFFFAMAVLPHRFAPPFGARSLILSLGLHLVMVVFILVAGWHKAPVTPTILEVSLMAPPSGDHAAKSGKAQNAAPPPETKAKARQLSSKPHVTLKTAPKVKKLRAPSASIPTQVVKEAPQKPQPLIPPALAPSLLSPPPVSVDSGPNRGAPEHRGIGGAANAAGNAGAAAGTGNGSGSVGTGPGTGGGGSKTLAVAQTQYLSLIRARILAHRQYPPLAKARSMEGEVRLRFIITQSGALSRGVQVVKPSGFSVLDEQASQCVLAAAPFPPFPPALQRDSLTVEVPIVYRLKDLSG